MFKKPPTHNDIELDSVAVPDLLQSYINALANLISMERAKIAAKQSEEVVMQNLSGLGTSNGVFVTGNDIPPELGEKVVKDSVSAHLTKIQSEQITQATLSEVAYSEAQLKKQYLGKKVIINIVDPKLDVVDAVYLDKNSPNYRISKYNAKSIKGTIEDISFEHNLLVIKPSYSARLLVPNRVLIHVYVINIESMTPNITIKF